MKTFLSTVKGKVIAGAITLAVIAAAVVTIVLLNTGYRSIQVADLNGSTKITAGIAVTEAFKGQKLQNNTSVSVSENSDLTLALDTDKHVYAKELTRFRLEASGTAGKDSRTIIRLEEGSVLNEIDEKLLDSESYVVDAPNATMAVRGTTFTVTVSYDENGLCHTAVEVSEGTVEVTEKDENGNLTDNTLTLNEGNQIEVISEINLTENPSASGTTSAPSGSGDTRKPLPEVDEEDAKAVAEAIVTYLNGGELDTTNFDRVTGFELFENGLFITLDGRFLGEGTSEVQNKVTNIDFLAEMTNLTTLKITNNQISDISPLKNLTNLTDLELSFNQISDISPLKNLTNLIDLQLSFNQISDISPLKDLTNLTDLELFGNQISDISPLLNLTDLTFLDLSGNQISDDEIAKLKQALPGANILN